MSSRDLETRIAELTAENQRLRDEAAGVATANVHAAMQLLELSETKQKELEAKNSEVQRALAMAEEASRQKTLFLANMSHELRTPLSSILGIGELLLQTKLTAEQTDYIETMANTATSFLDLINHLLDYTKMESGKMQVEAIDFDLWKCVESIADMLQVPIHKRNLTFDFSLDASVPRVVCSDALRLRQVLLNLGANAVKFTSHGRITFHISASRAEATAPDLIWVTFRFVDSGCGISETALQHLFQPFMQAEASTTRRFGGTGLGLAICREIVQHMGGSIEVQSTLGEGSTFTVTMPFRVPCTAPAGKPATPLGQVSYYCTNTATIRMLEAHLPTLGLQPHALIEPLPGKDDVAWIVELATLDETQLQRLALASRSARFCPILILPTQASSHLRETAARISSTTLFEPIRATHLERTFEGAGAKLASHGPSMAHNDPPPPKDTRIRVLLAEDTPVLQRVIRAQLEQLGCDVHAVGNGQEALQLFRTTTFDLVFMDCQMPEMDGFVATQAIRTLQEPMGSHVPIVALTANTMPSDRERCLASGMDDYLSKPVRSTDLQGALKRWAGLRTQD